MSNTSLQALTLHPWVYVLQCAPRDGTEYPTLYVGATLNAHQRITQHFTGTGARFTQIHKPAAVHELHVDVGSPRAPSACKSDCVRGCDSESMRRGLVARR